MKTKIPRFQFCRLVALEGQKVWMRSRAGCSVPPLPPVENILLTGCECPASIAPMNRVVTGIIMAAAFTSHGVAGLPRVIHYFDEVASRHLTVTGADFGKVVIEIRFVGAGSSSRWFGDGTQKDKEITFAQTVGEDQERGTFFVAKGGESKLEIGYKPGQRTPQDAGINGLYRHITDEKRLSLARKESGVSDDMLGQILKAAPKSWPSEDKPVAGEWKNRWPDLLQRWMGLIFKPAAPAPAAKPLPGVGVKADDASSPEKQADYWIARTETTNMAIGFLSVPLDKLIPPGWDGEYDDGFGGHVSLRLGRDGILRFSLTCTRGSGDGQTGELTGRIPVSALKKEKNGDFIAGYKHHDAELKPEEQQATVSLRKTGHFLFVETQYAERYRGRAWFDGIYRWGPVPTE